jgi:hypothetical protein
MRSERRYLERRPARSGKRKGETVLTKSQVNALLASNLLEVIAEAVSDVVLVTTVLIDR